MFEPGRWLWSIEHRQPCKVVEASCYWDDVSSAMRRAAGDFNGEDAPFVTHWLAQENGLNENLWADLNVRTNRSALGLPGTRTCIPGASITSGPSIDLVV
jgi:hypothetical protein